MYVFRKLYYISMLVKWCIRDVIWYVMWRKYRNKTINQSNICSAQLWLRLLFSYVVLILCVTLSKTAHRIWNWDACICCLRKHGLIPYEEGHTGLLFFKNAPLYKNKNTQIVFFFFFKCVVYKIEFNHIRIIKYISMLVNQWRYFNGTVTQSMSV